jgi:hypothetical protein
MTTQTALLLDMLNLNTHLTGSTKVFDGELGKPDD